MKKICVIFTGGTIASKFDKNGILLANENFELIDMFKQRDNRAIEIEYYQPYSTLSENLNYRNWEVLVRTVQKAVLKGYDGIILTHGTDTAAYTTALLSVLFSNVRIPICVVTSNYPLSDPRSNGYNNFSSAVDFIETAKEACTCLIYSQYGICSVHLGSEVMQCAHFTDEFKSRNECYGKMIFGKFEPNHELPQTQKLFSFGNLDKFTARCKVLLIHPYVGMDYNSINLDGCKGVVHATYHSGTVCCDDTENSISVLLKRCQEKNINCYIAPVTRKGNENYETTVDAIEKYGAIPLDATAELAYAKLVVACQMFGENSKIKSFMTAE